MSWCNDFKGKTTEELNELRTYFIVHGNHVASKSIYYFLEFYNKKVEVIKGRKVPIGTTGKVFWIGSYCHSKYGDPWGIYTTWKVGIKDDNGEVYWTSIDNIKLKEDEQK